MSIDEGMESIQQLYQWVSVHVWIKELMPEQMGNKVHCGVCLLKKIVENLKHGMKECRNAREISAN